MRVHVLGLPHTQTSEEFTSCAFTQKVLNLCKMLHQRGHEVIHYGVEGGQPECSEDVAIMPHGMWKGLYGHPGASFYNLQQDGPYAPYHALFADNLQRALRKRVGPPDTEIVCQTWGGAQLAGCKGIEQHMVESGIGYPESWAEWRVYESYAWMHMHLGRDRLFGGKKWYWAVIPNAFDLKNFTPQGRRGEDFLYMGRLNEDKGVAIAIAVAKEIGRRITIVGQGDPAPFLAGSPHATYMPPVGIEGRRKLLAEACAVFCPTQFVEPFCGVHVEAMLSGTPVITSDHGVFTETVLHGVTGYRARTFEQFVWSARNVDRLEGSACAAWARANYSLERVAPMYEEFFQQVLNVRDVRRRSPTPTGFYERHPNRSQLDWLVKLYPPEASTVTLDLERPHEAPPAPPPPPDEWTEAQEFERDWWGLEWTARWDDEIRKQGTYARLMGMGGSDFGRAEILDVGCGPVSMLQRTTHGPSRGVDPLPVSDATRARYREARVDLLSVPAEEMPVDRVFDEVWMYNCLQHTRSPEEILRRIAGVTAPGTSVRIFEWLEHGTAPGHPHNLTEALFWQQFGGAAWERRIWNVGTLRDVRGEWLDKYIAIHAVRAAPHEHHGVDERVLMSTPRAKKKSAKKTKPGRRVAAKKPALRRGGSSKQDP